MKKLALVFLLISYSFHHLLTQNNNDCAGATFIGTNSEWINFSSLTQSGVSPTFPSQFSGQIANGNKDYWRKVTTSGDLIYFLDGDFPYVAYSGDCNTLVPLEYVTLSNRDYAYRNTAGGTVYVRFLKTNANSGQSGTLQTVSLHSNNDCSSATSITVQPIGVLPLGYNSGSPILSSTSSIPSCLNGFGADRYYSLVAPTSGKIRINRSSSTIIQLYSGTCGNLELAYCNESYPELIPGATYFLRVNYQGFSDRTFSVEEVVPPTNDLCDNPLLINLNENIEYDANLYNSETENYIGSTPPPRTAYYSFVAPNTGNVIINGTSSVVRAIRLGSCTNPIDEKVTYGNRLNNLIPGSTYTLTLASGYDRKYNFRLIPGQAPPSNDNCGNAIQLAMNSVGSLAALGTATISENIPFTCRDTADVDVWMRFVAPSAGSIAFTAAKISFTNFNKIGFEIYSGSCGNLAFVNCGYQQEEYSLANLQPSAEYFIRVYKLNVTSASITTNVSVRSLSFVGLLNDNCTSAQEVTLPYRDALIQRFNEGRASNPPIFSCQERGELRADMWFRFMAPSSGSVKIDSKVILSVMDDGGNIGTDFMKQNKGSLGVKLIRAFSNRLDAEIEIENGEKSLVRVVMDKKSLQIRNAA